jgi:hypothetical protein
MRLLLCAALLLTVPHFARPAPIPRERQDSGLYHSTRKGDRWVYSYTDEREVESYVVTAVEEKSGCKIVSVGREEKGKVVETVVWSVSDKGLYELSTGDRKNDPPLGRVQLPAKTGDEWKITQDRAGWTSLRGVGKVTVSEEVRVPAGTFTTIRVDWTYKLDYATRSKSVWYAQGVGMVKLVDWDANKEYVLKSFTVGKE